MSEAPFGTVGKRTGFSTYLEPMLPGNHYFQLMLLKILGISQKVKIEIPFYYFLFQNNQDISVFRILSTF